jgi:hypothetical protein
VLLWFAGLAFVLVWLVFRDTAMDYRIVIGGALLPDAVDVLFGGARVMHTLVFSVGLLFLVMFATRRRRAARRRLLALPIGTLVHLVLDGMWRRTVVFWWPGFGLSFESTPLPSSERALTLIVAMEVAGLVALVWAWRRFRLYEPERRDYFLRTGRLGRDLQVAPGSPQVRGPASC